MASGRSYFHLTDAPSVGIEVQSAAGLCDSAITIHGYPCQEFVVSSFSRDYPQLITKEKGNEKNKLR